MATRKSSTALVKFDELFAQEAARLAAKEKPQAGFRFLTIQGSTLHLDGDPIKDNTIDLVALGSVHENQYFVGRYKPGSTQPPECYAFADENEEDPEKSMKPHPDAASPQAKTCAQCQHNIMGSADEGRGKACKNVRRLTFIAPDSMADARKIREAEVLALKVPVTSTSNWGRFLHRLNSDYGRPPWTVVTEVKTVPDAKTQVKVLFTLKQTHDQWTQDTVDAMRKKVAEVLPLMVAPRTPRIAAPEAPPPAAPPPAPEAPKGRSRKAADAPASKPAGAAPWDTMGRHPKGKK
jgi:DNA repair exonuclease SbcCD nuclease subunit